jgi:DNA replication protein DnaC
MGDRVVDRFREGGKLLIFDWKSYRNLESPKGVEV